MGATHLASLEKKAQSLKATLIFVDESGFSLLPTACRTRSPCGQTPILRHCFNWPKLSAISAVTPNPHAYLHLVRGTIASDEVIRFVASARAAHFPDLELITQYSQLRRVIDAKQNSLVV